MSFDRRTVQFNPPTQHPDADADVLASVLRDDGSIEVWEANFDGTTWWSSNATMIMNPVVSWAHKPEGIDLTGDCTAEPEPAGASHWTESEPVRLAASRANRVYLAGPMTGLPDLNFPAFNAEAATLRAKGLTVINPAEHGVVEGADWADYLRHDLAGLVSCERIHLLPGWSKSKGANLEVLVALMLGMEITYHPDATPAVSVDVVAFLDRAIWEMKRTVVMVEPKGWKPA